MAKSLFRIKDRESALQGVERLAEFYYPPTFDEDAMPCFPINQSLQNKETQEHNYFGRIAKIALTRFSELQKGEHITVPELKARLRRLRRAGYEVESYSRMNQFELWDYTMQLRAEVYRQAKTHCPDVLKEITNYNKRAKKIEQSKRRLQP